MYSQEHLKRNSAVCFEAKGHSGGVFLSLSSPQLVTANTHETTAETGGTKADESAKRYQSAEPRPGLLRRAQTRTVQPPRRHEWHPTRTRNADDDRTWTPA